MEANNQANSEEEREYTIEELFEETTKDYPPHLKEIANGDFYREKEPYQEIPIKPEIKFHRFTTEEVGIVLDKLYDLEINICWGWLWDLGMIDFSINSYSTGWPHRNDPQLVRILINPYPMLEPFNLQWHKSSESISGIAYVAAHLYDDFKEWYMQQ
jgi:hypothetical protein